MTNPGKAVVVIPSYRESGNLALLLPRIRKSAPEANILVVDDSTGDERDKTRALGGAHVRIVNRNGKGGRGSAVVDGMKIAAADPLVRCVVEMDADLAHEPEALPLFLAEIRKGADLVIGCRYMDGSAIVDWPWKRLIQSRIINAFLRLWLGIGIRDHTNGYRAYSRKAIGILLDAHLREQGFIALSESAYILKRRGCVIREVPIRFTDRKLGKSNANARELMRSLWGALRIRFVHG